MEGKMAMPTDAQNTDAAGVQGPDDGLDAFGAGLRRLRDNYPSKLSLEALAQRSGVPKSTLSAVLNGKKMPTEKTLSAIVKGLDGDVGVWLARRERLRLAASGVIKDATATPAAEADSVDELGPAEANININPSSVLRPRWLLVLLLVLALLIGAGIGTGVTWTVTKPRNPLSPGIVKSGDDPALAPACLADAKVDAAETRLTNYLLEIIWSANCRAGWGRITRYDDKSQGNRIAVTTYLQADPNGPNTQKSDDADAQSSYTDLIATHSVNDRICVKGTVTRLRRFSQQ